MPASDAAAVLGPDGAIARRLSGYEVRPQQLRMADGVARAIESREHLMVEAGTGVGKSFAYLVPAILAAEQGAKVVVSTHTISLQEQLLNKDIPFLRSVMPVEFSAVLVKGRGNYLSLRRLKGAVERSLSTWAELEDVDQLSAIRDWTKQTRDGSLSDLPFRPSPAAWDAVASEHGNCLGKKCSTYKECFYFQARRRVGSANILIVNHALYMTDLAVRETGAAVLPDHDLVIFDEAHTLEQVAGHHLGLSLSSHGVDIALARLFNERTNRGLLAFHRMVAAVEQARKTRAIARGFFQELLNWQATSGARNGRLRQRPNLPEPLSEELVKLGSAIRRGANEISSEEDQIELIAAAERCEELGHALRRWMSQDAEEGAVYWLEPNPSRARISLHCAPLDVGPVLRRTLFDRVPCCILTSATLATGDRSSFQFAKERLGLTRCETLAVGSPFDYASQVTLHIATDLPDPVLQAHDFERAGIGAIRHYLTLSRGKAFVLFTSYRYLRDAEAALTPWFAAQNIRLLSQAAGMPRSRMLETFKADLNSVIFGVDSFWQGVDVPGEALSNVIITRLPFSVPDEPLTEARLEAIQARGGNSFLEFSIPEAILKFKQGFGRLIRSRTDQGMVVILDPRVVTKRYGRQFLDALPACPRKLDRLGELLETPTARPARRNEPT